MNDDIERYDPNEAAARAQELAEAAAELARLAAEAAELAAQGPAMPAGDDTPGTGLVPLGGELDAVSVKEIVATRRNELARMTGKIEQARKELEERVRNQISELHDVIAPLQKQMQLAEETLWTANLYLGRDEEIVTLLDGEAASAATPIVVRQMVLSMDQECAVAAEEGGIDAMTIELFDRWLLEDPAHLHQVLPETKGVVVLVPRVTSKDYNDPWKQKTMDEANRQSYWLIRNGDRLYRMSTDFVVGKHLVPTRDEFTSFFRARKRNWTTGGDEWVELEPGSRDWLNAEEAANARQRHYMRVALILQGLIDRTTVFHPLPAATVKLTGPDAYDAGYIQIVTDAELALTTGRESFRDWQRRLNAELRPGMRIVGAFDTSDFSYGLRRESKYGGGHTRIHPEHASLPKAGELYTIEDRKKNGELIFRFERTDKRWGYEHGDWGRRGEWPYKTRASCTLKPGDRFVIPFDLATVAEMETYITARGERHDYLTLIPLLRTAIAAKREEETLEAPFRQLLTGELIKANGVDGVDAEAAVSELVHWWKLANRWHRPLVTDDVDQQNKAIRTIVAEHARRLADAANADPAETTRLAELRGSYDAVLVARKRDRSWVVFEPEQDILTDKPSTVFVRRHVITAGGRVTTTGWVLAASVRTASWRILHSDDRWAAMDMTATLAQYLTGPEITAGIADAIRLASERKVGPVLGVVYDEGDREFHVTCMTKIPKPPKHPLGTKGFHGREFPHRRVTKVVVRWERANRTEVTYPRVWDSERPWWFRDEDPFEHGGRDMFLVHVNHDKLVAAQAGSAALKAANLTHNRLLARIRNVSDAMRAAWTAKAEADAYATFLDDYGDPDLWEGHRKTLKFVYPNDRSSFGDSDMDLCTEGLVLAEHQHSINLVGTVSDLVVAASAALGKALPVPKHVGELHIDLPAPAALGVGGDAEDEEEYLD